jgi:hypothetical protein
MTTRYITPAETRAKLMKWQLGNVSDDTFTGLLELCNTWLLSVNTGDSRQARRLFDKLKGYIAEHGFGESTGTYPATQDGVTVMKAIAKGGGVELRQAWQDVWAKSDRADFVRAGIDFDAQCSEWLGTVGSLATELDTDFEKSVYGAVDELGDLARDFMDAQGRGSSKPRGRASRLFWETQYTEAGRQAVRQADIVKDVEASEGRGFLAVVKSYQERTGCDWETAAKRVAADMPELAADYMAG